jgi:predicted PurR-regulated permease PerM
MADTNWNSQRIARTALIIAVVLFSVFMLWRFLPALAWAGVLAIASWPLRDALAQRRLGRTTIATLLTLVVAIVLVLPLIRLGIEAADQSRAVLKWLGDVHEHGLGAPDWLSHLPYIGDRAAAWWQTNLAAPGAAGALFESFKPNEVFNFTRALGIEVANRLTILVFTLLALFFLYRDGPSVIKQAHAIADRLFGPPGWQIAQNAVVAVRGAVNGLVLVGLLEGVLLGVAYWVVALPHAALLGLATGVLATIPFGAVVIYVGCALVLFARAQTTAAIALIVFGLLVGFAADHLVRPALIGKSTRLPFLWALLGILGGLETFGLIGLFLGPAIMSILVTIWRQGQGAA